jgi:hypothetical protein
MTAGGLLNGRVTGWFTLVSDVLVTARLSIPPGLWLLLLLAFLNEKMTNAAAAQIAMANFNFFMVLNFCVNVFYQGVLPCNKINYMLQQKGWKWGNFFWGKEYRRR